MVLLNSGTSISLFQMSGNPGGGGNAGNAKSHVENDRRKRKAHPSEHHNV